MSERVGNVSRTRYEQLVAEARELVAQVAKAQFGLGGKALKIEPMRPVGGSVAKGTDDRAVAAFSSPVGGQGPGAVKGQPQAARSSRWG